MDKWVVEAMELCKKLNNKGVPISITMSHGNITMEHRQPSTHELICSITIRDCESTGAVASMMDYIYTVKTEVFNNADNS